jgi:DNA helicase II / ATP-dependent DNA helicase PcrA
MVPAPAPLGRVPHGARRAWSEQAGGARYAGSAVTTDPTTLPATDPTTDPLLAPLNEAQRQAVSHVEGPALVVAGAGSGKTRTVVHRIAYLLRDHDVLPQQVLAVTFTNKAAGELRERVESLVGASGRDLWVATFHGACLRVLRSFGEHVGLAGGFGIYDDGDQLDLLKEILATVRGLEDVNPRALRAVIDRAKSNLMTPERLEAEGERMLGHAASGLPIELVAEVYGRYEARLRRANAVDFNDILGRTVELFQNVPDVLDRVQQRAVFIHVDEYQDTNAAQYELTRLLAEKYRNLMAVGDPDQCLPPETMVLREDGAVPIDELAVGDRVLGTGGSRTPVFGRVTSVHRGHYRGPLWEVATSSSSLRGTPHHVVLSRLVPDRSLFYVYLMWRADRGWRIGTTRGLRSGDARGIVPGIKIRLNQEHGDKVWLLRTCGSETEARYWEAKLSAEYGLPTALFHAMGRDLAQGDVWLKRLFLDLDTDSAARRLMAAMHLHPDFPHHRAQGGTRRQCITVGSYQDNRHGDVGYHRVSWSSRRPEIGRRLREAGLPVRTNGRGGWRLEVSRKSLPEALQLARAAADVAGLEIRRTALVDGRIYAFQPLAHLHPGMAVLVDADGSLVEAGVTDVRQVPYDGPVFDLEVDGTHSYIADGTLVHNSIYMFRGADVRNILDFQRDYEDAAVYRLEVNYRSAGSVLGVANALIRHNQGRLEKDLRPAKGQGAPVQRFFANDHRAEADFVARTVERFKGEGMRYADCAVLYRTNAQSRVLEEALRRSGIPATIVGGVGFYDRREVKDVLSYARAALNAADDVSLRRVLNRPKRGIGKTSEDALTAWAQRQGVPFGQALRSADEVIGGTGAARRVREFLELMDDLAEAAETLSATQFLKALLDSSGYLQALKDEGSHESLGRIENLDELVSAVAEWEEESGGGIAAFLDEAALMSSVDDRAVAAVNEVVDDDAVTLMTLHNAKGLEFPVVFLVGLEEQLIPHRSATGSLQEIEEERRLLYVGITRAQERLFMVHCGSRMSFGRTEFARASRFLEDLPKDATVEVDVLGQAIGQSSRTTVPSRSAWSPATSPAAAGGEGATYRGGEKVRHPKFGAGTVVGVSGQGSKAEVTVVFAEAGAKRLLVRFAHLERV